MQIYEYSFYNLANLTYISSGSISLSANLKKPEFQSYASIVFPD